MSLQTISLRCYTKYVHWSRSDYSKKKKLFIACLCCLLCYVYKCEYTGNCLHPKYQYDTILYNLGCPLPRTRVINYPENFLLPGYTSPYMKPTQSCYYNYNTIRSTAWRAQWPGFNSTLSRPFTKELFLIIPTHIRVIIPGRKKRVQWRPV